jgi:NAD(P)-dependent dehydrogenase (short-subunit alcohol dehydrogenase family)
MKKLAGKAAIVTGGAKGIGRHYCMALADEGAQVMVADIADGAEVAREIVAKHGQGAAESAVFDVSDEKAVKQLVSRTLERFGKIDVLVNNAALIRQSFLRAADGDRCRALGQGHGDQCARAVLHGEACRAAHEGAKARQDHQYRLGHRAEGHAEFPALRNVEGRDHLHDAGHVARTRRRRHLREYARAGADHERHTCWKAARIPTER